MTAKDILNELNHIADGRILATPEEILALLQAEIDKCLPEKRTSGNYHAGQVDNYNRRADYIKQGYNQALTDVRHRLREFIDNE